MLLQLEYLEQNIMIIDLTKESIIMLDIYNELLTIDDLCETLMIGRNTAYRLLNSGSISAFRIGRCWKIPKSSVQDFLQRGKSVL